MRRLVVFSFLAVLLGFLPAGQASADATVSMRLTIQPMQCTVEVIDDGTVQTTRLVPAGCSRAFTPEQLAHAGIETGTKTFEPAHRSRSFTDIVSSVAQSSVQRTSILSRAIF